MAKPKQDFDNPKSKWYVAPEDRAWTIPEHAIYNLRCDFYGKKIADKYRGKVYT